VFKLSRGSARSRREVDFPGMASCPDFILNPFCTFSAGAHVPPVRNIGHDASAIDRDGDDQCLVSEPNKRLKKPAGLRTVDSSASSSQ
jgi:hypothetical protein